MHNLDGSPNVSPEGVQSGKDCLIYCNWRGNTLQEDRKSIKRVSFLTGVENTLNLINYYRQGVRQGDTPRVKRGSPSGAGSMVLTGIDLLKSYSLLLLQPAIQGHWQMTIVVARRQSARGQNFKGKLLLYVCWLASPVRSGQDVEVQLHLTSGLSINFK